MSCVELDEEDDSTAGLLLLREKCSTHQSPSRRLSVEEISAGLDNIPVTYEPLS